MIRGKQDDIAFAGYTAQHKDFGEEAGNSSWREINDSHDLFANHHVRCISLGNLGTGTLQTQRPKINYHFDCRNASFQEGFGLHYGTYSDVILHKIFKSDH